MKNTRLPWLTWPALERIKAWGDLSTKRVLEWGSGGSTLYWSDRGAAELVSIEHDSQWFDQVVAELGSRTTCSVYLVSPDLAAAPGYESEVVPGSFERYVTWPMRVIRTHVGFHPHIVLVDGRARPACLAVAAELALEAVILDNSERPRYAAAMRACGEKLLTRGFVERTYTGSGPYSPKSTWSTTIWERQK